MDDAELPQKEDSAAVPRPTPKKKSNAIFERKSVVFGPGDAKILENLVRVGGFHRWAAPNNSTLIRALIRTAAEAYGDEVFPKAEPWALHLHERLRSNLEVIRAGGAKRGPKG